MSKGILISFEGGEGCGKSTQIQMTKRYLESLGFTVFVTREPGGVSLGEEIREMLLSPKNKGMEHITELFLFNASRHEHVQKVVIPALEKYDFVLLDRYYHSTLAYQGYGRGIDPAVVWSIVSAAIAGIIPNLTIILDVEPSVGIVRAAKQQALDRIEQEGLDFHEKARQGFLSLAKEDPIHLKVVDGTGSEEEVFEAIKAHLDVIIQKG